jgi:hypothetical protein
LDEDGECHSRELRLFSKKKSIIILVNKRSVLGSLVGTRSLLTKMSLKKNPEVEKLDGK